MQRKKRRQRRNWIIGIIIALLAPSTGRNEDGAAGIGRNGLPTGLG